MQKSVLEKKQLSRIWNILSDLLVFVVCAISSCLVGLRLTGHNFYTVMSGSMEPKLKVGSIVLVRPVDASTLKPGDIISYMTATDIVVTHRIAEVVPDENDPSIIRFITKGDANKTVDGKQVDYRNVIGKVVFTVPLIGYPVNTIQRPPMIYFAIAIGAFLLASVFLPSVEKKERREVVTS